MRNDKPVLVVFAGPNGSGKSTMNKIAIQRGTLDGPYINADDMTREKLGDVDVKTVSQAQMDAINRDAANQADQLRQQAIDGRISFITETVMSTPAKIRLMSQAKAAGYEVCLIYVTTQDPAINVQRVRDRVAKGGHNVPEEKIAARYTRAMGLLPVAIQVADMARVYDNSSERPALVFEKTGKNELKAYPLSKAGEQYRWNQATLEQLKRNILNEELNNKINE